jgi:Domain of unknown function (DUF4266)
MTRLPWLALLILLSACTPVRPWQRGTLAHRCMGNGENRENLRARQHLLGARESSQGATGETGGGCGCN